MGIQQGLYTTISKLSDGNCDQPFAFYWSWFDIAQAHSEIPPDQVLDAITSATKPGCGRFIHLTALLALHFAGDAGSDGILAPHSVDLRILGRFGWFFPHQRARCDSAIALLAEE